MPIPNSPVTRAAAQLVVRAAYKPAYQPFVAPTYIIVTSTGIPVVTLSGTQVVPSS